MGTVQVFNDIPTVIPLKSLKVLLLPQMGSCHRAMEILFFVVKLITAFQSSI